MHLFPGLLSCFCSLLYWSCSAAAASVAVDWCCMKTLFRAINERVTRWTAAIGSIKGWISSAVRVFPAPNFVQQPGRPTVPEPSPDGERQDSPGLGPEQGRAREHYNQVLYTAPVPPRTRFTAGGAFTYTTRTAIAVSASDAPQEFHSHSCAAANKRTRTQPPRQWNS